MHSPYWRTLTRVGPKSVHFTFNLQTKLEMSSCIRSKVIAWAQNVENLKYLAAAVAEIFQVCKILKHITRPWPRPFQGRPVISRLPLTFRPNLKFLTTPITKTWKAVKNVEIGIVWGLGGHSRSSAMSPFDRAHTTFYLTFIETARLLCTVFEI